VDSWSVFLPFPEEEISDFIAHGQIIIVFTVIFFIAYGAKSPKHGPTPLDGCAMYDNASIFRGSGLENSKGSVVFKGLMSDFCQGQVSSSFILALYHFTLMLVSPVLYFMLFYSILSSLLWNSGSDQV